MDGTILLARRWSRQRNLIEIGNRNTNDIKIDVENANLCGEEICDMHTSLKCAKYAAIAYLRKTDILSADHFSVAEMYCVLC